jgi:glycosyltransferase involved in cell wall biosynthesis
VVDAMSTDDTVAQAKKCGAVVLQSPQKGRAIQMNMGAALAQYPILYFIHADSIPPSSFYEDILQAVNENYGMGRYRTTFEGNKWYLKLNAFFTRFDWFFCYGGDQTLFVTAQVFHKINGYNANLKIMEEYDFVARAKNICQYKIFSKATIVSIRKYHKNSWLKVQRANYIVMKMYKKGASQDVLLKQYNKMLQGLR